MHAMYLFLAELSHMDFITSFLITHHNSFYLSFKKLPEFGNNFKDSGQAKLARHLTLVKGLNITFGVCELCSRNILIGNKWVCSPCLLFTFTIKLTHIAKV